MSFLPDILLTIAIVAAALFILVFFHELGHFLAAKACRMRVDKFSIGFPPRILGFKRGETEYSIGATPFGGYVKIAGMVDESMDTDFAGSEPQPWEYRSKPVWQRMVVITAGVVFNMILAALIYIGMALAYGETMIPTDRMPGLHIAEDSFAHEVGFRDGDRIVGVNGKRPENFADLFSPAELTASSLTYQVERDGQMADVPVPPRFLDRLGQEGLVDVSNAIPSLIGFVQPGSPAESAGLRPGDQVDSVNGMAVTHWLQVNSLIAQADSSVLLAIQRQGEPVTVATYKDPETGMVGINYPPVSEVLDVMQVRYSLFGAVKAGVSDTGENFTGILQGLAQLVTGRLSLRENLGGPVAIASITREATDTLGLQGFWSITAFLSITLAIMNMLPIPVLDGGHFVFLLYEGVTRRELSMRVRIALQQIGMALLLGLFIFITFNDILKALG